MNSADHYLIVGKSKFRSIYDNFRLFMRLDVDKIKILLGKSPSIFPNYTSDLETNDKFANMSDFDREEYFMGKMIVHQRRLKEQLSESDASDVIFDTYGKIDISTLVNKSPILLYGWYELKNKFF